MNFNLEISTESKDQDIKQKCLDAVQEVLEKDGEYFGAGYTTDTLVEPERERKIVMEGKITYSFGKNGKGLTDELLQIGAIVEQLSRNNHVYIEEAFIDACDDVYDLKFNVIPHEENKWMMKENAFNKNQNS